MKNLSEYLNEAVKNRLNLDEMSDTQLKKFANELANYINDKFKLDEKIDLEYFLKAIKALRGHRLMIVLSDFDYGELPETGHVDTLFMRVYHMIYFYDEKSNTWTW